MVPLEYLASLVDMNKINEFAWDENFLAATLNEVRKYQKKRNEGKTAFWIGGCLLMFAIIYMDFVEVPRLLVFDHRIEYSLPRACFLCNDDFQLIDEMDRNKLSLDKIDFRKRNLRRLAETPYVRLVGCNETHRQNNSFVGVDAHIPDIPSNPAMDGCEISVIVAVIKGWKMCNEDMILRTHEKSVVAEVVVGDLKDQDVGDEGQSLILSQGTVAALQGLAMELDDGPSMSLFKEGTEDFEWFNMDAEAARNYKEANRCMETPNHVVAPPDVEQPVSAGPTYDNTPKHAMQGNNPKLPVQNEADGPCFDTKPKLHRPTHIPRPIFESSPIAFGYPLVSPVLVRVQQGQTDAVA
ncbi:cytokinin-o-glucosyltransferase 2 [Hordeum vulgare]|nr:cytokinin-o-glucosyltransferase 2 [Hordeum vulgare]